MTTLSVLSLFASCLAGYVVIELVIWFLEAVFATAKYFVCYLMSKPCSWKRSYLQIRTIFTWVLNKLSFAELSARQVNKHRTAIEAYVRGLITKRNRKKNVH